MEIDPDNGAIATLTCPRRELIAVTERLAPNVECLLHGNLPDSIGVGADEVAASSNEITVAHHPTLETKALPSAGATRIDVDRRGKLTLVNAMR